MDVEELACAAKHDPAACKELFRLIHRELQAMRGSFADADDVVQETMLAVYRKLGQFQPRGPGSFFNWVRGFARIEARSQLRQGRERRDRNEAIARATKSPSNVSSRVVWRQRRQLVLRELEVLPTPQRRAIEIALEGGDAEDVAEGAGVSRDYARTLQNRAIQRLRKRLAGRTRPRSGRMRPVLRIKWRVRPRERSPSSPQS